MLEKMVLEVVNKLSSFTLDPHKNTGFINFILTFLDLLIFRQKLFLFMFDNKSCKRMKVIIKINRIVIDCVSSHTILN